ncbi:hypothetical protein [Methylocystis iwaonis]|uniref:hypothetical protein n=1 Tax=Methylocystis iwaonis TaxID=2885079 RepID=UPI002493B402|nr:hypothetical protein [Methylocystis iwaonis]
MRRKVKRSALAARLVHALLIVCLILSVAPRVFGNLLWAAGAPRVGVERTVAPQNAICERREHAGDQTDHHADGLDCCVFCRFDSDKDFLRLGLVPAIVFLVEFPDAPTALEFPTVDIPPAPIQGALTAWSATAPPTI